MVLDDLNKKRQTQRQNGFSKFTLLSLLEAMCVILGIKIAESFFVTYDTAEFCFVHAL